METNFMEQSTLANLKSTSGLGFHILGLDYAPQHPLALHCDFLHGLLYCDSARNIQMQAFDRSPSTFANIGNVKVYPAANG